MVDDFTKAMKFLRPSKEGRVSFLDTCTGELEFEQQLVSPVTELEEVVADIGREMTEYDVVLDVEQGVVELTHR